MKRSRRGLSIDMVIDRGIFKNNQITPFSCFTFMPKKTAVSFYYADFNNRQSESTYVC